MLIEKIAATFQHKSINKQAGSNSLWPSIFDNYNAISTSHCPVLRHFVSGTREFVAKCLTFLS